MSDRDDREDPRADLIMGIGLLWRAARKTAKGLRKDLEHTNVGRGIEDAGRELVRAATNVVGRLGDELKKVQGPQAQEPPEASAEADDPEHPPDGGAPLRDRQRPANPGAGEPGFRIAADDDEPKRGGEQG